MSRGLSVRLKINKESRLELQSLLGIGHSPIIRFNKLADIISRKTGKPIKNGTGTILRTEKYAFITDFCVKNGIQCEVVEKKKRKKWNPTPYQAKPQKKRKGKLSFVQSNDFLLSFEWRRVRYAALQRNGRKCQCCGATPKAGAILNVDHIKPRRKYPELALDIDNLQVLCHECNHGKGNWDETDHR